MTDNQSKIDLIAELIAIAVGVDITNVEHKQKFRAYLDLYADEKEQYVVGCAFQKPLVLHGNTAEELFVNGMPPLEYVHDMGGDPSDTEKAHDKPNLNVFGGRGGTEKREIFNRVVSFRKENGLSYPIILAKASNGAITDNEIRDMMDAHKYPIEKWRALAAALDSFKQTPQQK